jgi:hypothetical protein
MRFLGELVFGIEMIKLLIKKSNLSSNLKVSDILAAGTYIDDRAQE